MERVWARIENGKVVNIEVWDETPGISQVTHKEITNIDPRPGKDWDYDSDEGTFSAPEVVVDPRPFLHIQLSENEINLDATITIDASVRVGVDSASDIITAFTAVYKLTIKNDANSAMRIKMNFVNGVADQISITPKFPGLYTLTHNDLKDTQIVKDIVLDVIG